MSTTEIAEETEHMRANLSPGKDAPMAAFYHLNAETCREVWEIVFSVGNRYLRSIIIQSRRTRWSWYYRTITLLCGDVKALPKSFAHRWWQFCHNQINKLEKHSCEWGRCFTTFDSKKATLERVTSECNLGGNCVRGDKRNHFQNVLQRWAHPTAALLD